MDRRKLDRFVHCLLRFGLRATKTSIGYPVLLLALLRASFTSVKSLIKSQVAGEVSLSSRSRLCLFSHFDSEGLIDQYVIHYLEELHKNGCSIVFVTTSKHLSDKEVGKIVRLVSKVIVRKNIGRDFGSWRLGMLSAGELTSFEQVILANDSVYGPMFSLSGLFSNMADKGFDIWGITDSWERAYHLQSYFLVFSAKAVKSAFFEEFWNSYRLVSNKEYIINKYEVGLTQLAVRHGFRVGALCNYLDVCEEALRDRTFSHAQSSMLLRRAGVEAVNPSRFFWRTLIERFDCPFLKVELVRDNPSCVPDIGLWRQIISRHTTYDIDLVLKHVNRVAKCRTLNTGTEATRIIAR